MCKDALVVPNGVVPDDGEVDFEHPPGVDCILKSLLEVLYEIDQEPDC